MGSPTIATRDWPAESQDSTAPWQAAPVKAVNRLFAWIRNKRRIRRAIDELMALDDRMLSDIGLTRGSIEPAARYGRFSTTVNGSVHQQPTAPQRAWAGAPWNTC
jgi:uncharacterized protein YjiS (DUF1127 family)